MSDRLLNSLRAVQDSTWVERTGDWAGLYDRHGDLIWQGHPGDFEWAYHLGMTTRYSVEVGGSRMPETLAEL